jgi:hypothetical protein
MTSTLCRTWPLAFLFALCVAGCVSNPTATPSIISVEEWGGIRATPDIQRQAKLHRPHQLKWITLHHGGVIMAAERDPKEYLLNLQKWSRDTRQWSDIPYHYLIDLDGKIYEGRDVTIAGDTNTEYDPSGHALIMLMGDYNKQIATQKQLDSVVDAMVMIARQFNLSADTIAMHKTYSKQTECPGKQLAELIEQGYFKNRVAAALHKSRPL